MTTSRSVLNLGAERERRQNEAWEAYADARSDLIQAHGVVENDKLSQGNLLERSDEIPPQTIRCCVMKEDTWVPLFNAVASVLQNIGKVRA